MADGAREKATAIAAIDLLMNLLMLFVVVSAIAVARMNRPAQEKAVDPKAELLIELSWADHNFDDLDLWVLLPDGRKVGFTNKDVGVVSLDRDDRGAHGDLYRSDGGEERVIPVNREVAAVRAVLPGRYAVNVHYYHDFSESDIGAPETSASPDPVIVKLTRLNPRVVELVTRRVALGKVGSQPTAFCFELDASGAVTNIDETCSIPFVPTTDRQPDRRT
jgi:hypothetical protein